MPISIPTTISISMAKVPAISKRVCTVSKSITISSIRMVKSIGISFGLSLTLGNMDNSSRVGNISASTGIGTMDSRDGSRGNTMDTYSVGNIGNTLDSMVDRDSMDSMVDRGSMNDMVASIAKMSKMMP